MPSTALAPVQRAVSGLCLRFGQAYSDLDKAFKTNDAGLYFRSQKEMARATAEIVRVRQLVDAWSPSRTHGLPTKTGDVAASHIDPRFGAAASAVAGFPVDVRCWSEADWPRIQDLAAADGLPRPFVRDLGGLADPTANWIDLSPSSCRALIDVTYHGDRAGDHAAFALTILAHEATHLRGDTNGEADTECYAMQRDRIVGPKLGVSKRGSETLARVYWHDLYPEDLPRYRSSDCHDGGPLDLHPQNLSWP